MDDLNQKITEILQDPGRIQQIMEMASSIGLQPPEDISEQVTNALHRTEAKDKRQETLVRALLPYLHPNRQARLERAMQISHLTRIAGAAFKNAQLSTTSSEDGEPHV